MPSEMEYRAAFRFVYDTLEAMVLQSHYFLLGQAAYAVKNSDYTPSQTLEVGIQSNRLTPEVKETLKEWGYVQSDKGWSQVKHGTEIVFKEIKRKYQFFQYPDTQYFDVDEYKIPNPFDNYWKARFIVQ